MPSNTQMTYLRLTAAILFAVPSLLSQPAPEKILEAINTREGAVICEIGAGDGALTIAAAQAVGPRGRVYSSELGEKRLSRLREKIAASRLEHITVVEGSSHSTNFPEQGCDAIFMRDVYHHFSDPAAINASIAAALKPGGRAAIVDFAPPGEEAKHSEGRSKGGSHGVTPSTVLREMNAAGLDSVGSEVRGGRWFMVVVTKPQALPS
jgi:ubiquinone/menaquinone biosynthesis C-methylase UbiE